MMYKLALFKIKIDLIYNLGYVLTEGVVALGLAHGAVLEIEEYVILNFGDVLIQMDHERVLNDLDCDGLISVGHQLIGEHSQALVGP